MENKMNKIDHINKIDTTSVDTIYDSFLNELNNVSCAGVRCDDCQYDGGKISAEYDDICVKSLNIKFDKYVPSKELLLRWLLNNEEWWEPIEQEERQ